MIGQEIDDNDNQDDDDNQAGQKLCLTCGRRNNTAAWGKRHYYSYAQDDHYHPWICAYTREPANIIDIPQFNENEMSRSVTSASTIEEEAEAENDDDVLIIIADGNRQIPLTPVLLKYVPSKDKMALYFETNIKTKHVVANQLIKKGGSKCTDCYDIENHHMYKYCTLCKRNLYFNESVYECIIRFLPGKICPKMNPRYLINEPW